MEKYGFVNACAYLPLSVLVPIPIRQFSHCTNLH